MQNAFVVNKNKLFNFGFQLEAHEHVGKGSHAPEHKKQANHEAEHANLTANAHHRNERSVPQLESAR